MQPSDFELRRARLETYLVLVQATKDCFRELEQMTGESLAKQYRDVVIIYLDRAFDELDAGKKG